MNGDLLLYNGCVVTETHAIENGYLLIDGGEIISYGEGPSNKKDCANAEVNLKIDCKSMYIVPGFIDIHTHGIMDVDFMESPAEKIVEGLNEYTRYGVTGVLGTTLSNPLYNILKQLKEFRKVREDKTFGNVLIGAHIEGPWLAPRCRGGHALEYLVHPDRDDVERLLGEAGDIIKTVTFAPELNNSIWLAERLTREGIIPVIGHTEATYEQTEAVIRAGARHVTHMYDALLSYKENPKEALVMMPGVETSVVLHDEVSIELIGCPIHVPKPFFRYINKVKPADKKIIVTDSLVGTGMKNGTILTCKDGRKVYVRDGVLRMIDDDPSINGNLTGSAVTMNLALKRLVAYTGQPLPEALRWATINPAKLLGLDQSKGSIKPGKDADIVVMDENFNVKVTVLKGSIVYRSSDL
ncbi:MAG: N-acetylglucosamine-6-phosphate deacetylase [Spirochaetes bacterium]|nr:MAG: N-acetylglucosamine-6-phosphate deacetylase [Spirochaetota bacterium]